MHAEPVYAPQPYSFGYDTVDEYGNKQFRQETSDANNAKTGSYGYTDANGVYRRVDYVADAAGFRATISTNEPGECSICSFPKASRDDVSVTVMTIWICSLTIVFAKYCRNESWSLGWCRIQRSWRPQNSESRCESFIRLPCAYLRSARLCPCRETRLRFRLPQTCVIPSMVDEWTSAGKIRNVNYNQANAKQSESSRRKEKKKKTKEHFATPK